MSLLSHYETYITLNRKITSLHTDRLYRISLRQFDAAIGHAATLADLTDDNLIRLEKHLSGRSVETINHSTKRIKALWRWLCKRGLITVWPTSEKLRTPEPYRRAWNVDEVRKILAACETFIGDYGGVPASKFWRVWHLVQWETGERTGALLQLPWSSVTKKGLDIEGSIRKEGKAAFYVLSPQVLAELNNIRKPARELVFAWPLSKSSFYLHYGRLLSKAGLPNTRKYKPQRMRRTHLTLWHAAGQDATARAKHASPHTTATHYLDETQLPQANPADVLPPL